LVDIFLKKTGSNSFLPKERPGALGFCVGDMVTHEVYGAGVVFGWTPVCSACGEPETEEERVKRTQPYVNVFFDNGSARYCPQQNLALDRDPQVLKVVL
jgi:hemimethylated DNA binding protein